MTKKLNYFNISVFLVLFFVSIGLYYISGMTKYTKPDKIENTILIKDTTIIVLEYIPHSGNLLTSASSWYDRKTTYYFKNKKGGLNMWSKDFVWRPYYTVTQSYNYYKSPMEIEMDTIFYDSCEYGIN